MARNFFTPKHLAAIAKQVTDVIDNLTEAAKVFAEYADAMEKYADGQGPLVHFATIEDHYLPEMVEWSETLPATLRKQLRRIRDGKETKEQKDKDRHAQAKAAKAKPKPKPPAKKK